MPSIYDEVRIPRIKGQDKRIKLTNEDKENIKNEWIPHTSRDNKKSEGSIHSLAKKYGVSRRTISSIVKDKPVQQIPYKRKKDLNWESGSKEKRRQYSRSYRQHQKYIYTKNQGEK